MAFRRRSSFGRRGGFSRRPRNLKWTGQALDAEDTVAAGVTDTLVLLAPGDYAGGQNAGTVEAGAATLVRIRGTVSMRATVLGGVAFMYIAVIGELEPPWTGIDLRAITSGDVIWQRAEIVPIDTSRTIEIDVRVKRRLENDRVVFVITGVAQTITYVPVFRVLMRSSS